MLRHLRMTPTKEIPKAEGRICCLFQDWIQPFYRYRIAHSPSPRDRVCGCAYPLFTLRSSRRSPYDEPTMLSAMHETVYVDSTGKSTSSPASEMPDTTQPSTSAGSPATTGAPGDVADTSRTTPSPSSSGTSAFLSSFGNLPSLKARWAIRRRRGGRLTAPPPSTETCYRCDICDGLQRPADDAANTKATMTSSQASTSAARTGAWKEEMEEEEADEEDADASAAAESNTGGGDERYGHTTSTDIANTAMEDADVAELRHLDPFHVEVFGKPSWGALLKRSSREIQGQLSRCGLRKRDMARYAAQATANSEVARQAYRRWVRTEAQRVREEQRRSMQPSADPLGTTSPPASGTPSLTLSNEQRAIVKGKLDTLHVAAYLARYAMAAYGLPYELNFFTSVRELTKLSAEPHSRYVCANSEEQLESMRRMLQGEEPDVLLECVASRYSLRVGQPCWSLFLDHVAQRVILTFRGSLTAADLLVDVMEGYANVMLERVDDGAASSSPPQRVCTAVPLGFYDSTVEAGAQLLPLLRTIHAQYGSYTLCVTGHSLGGILASVFHILYCGPWRASLHSSSSLLRRTKTLRCPSTVESEPTALVESTAESTHAAHVPFTKTITCTFAAAPVIEKRVTPVVNAWLEKEEERTGSRLVAMTHGMDLVTRLQIHSLQETFQKAYSVATTSTVGGPNPKPAETSPATDLEVPSVSERSGVPILAVPGCMYNVTAGTRRRYLLTVPLTAVAVREQMIVTAESVLQHFPCLYLRSLTELLNRYEAKWNSLALTPPPDDGLTCEAISEKKEDEKKC